MRDASAEHSPPMIWPGNARKRRHTPWETCVRWQASRPNLWRTGWQWQNSCTNILLSLCKAAPFLKERALYCTAWHLHGTRHLKNLKSYPGPIKTGFSTSLSSILVHRQTSTGAASIPTRVQSPLLSTFQTWLKHVTPMLSLLPKRKQGSRSPLPPMLIRVCLPMSRAASCRKVLRKEEQHLFTWNTNSSRSVVGGTRRRRHFSRHRRTFMSRPAGTCS